MTDAEPHHPQPSATETTDHPSRGILTTGPVGKTLVRKALPMVFGLASIIVFEVIDIFFIGQLGTSELAAMSFTFPVTFTVLSISVGMSIGVMAVIAQAVGCKDESLIRRLTTDGILLANALIVLIAILGLASQKSVFQALGAPLPLIPKILEYMTLWWLGVGFLVFPIIGNAAIRATGDMKTPAYIMMASGLLNLSLDPLFIFGFGAIPRMELFGASLASVLSSFIISVVALGVIVWREKMLIFKLPAKKELFASWRAILRVGLPAALTYLLVPLASAILTRVIANQGTAEVAAWGVAQRIEGLSTIGIVSFATALIAFVAQNIGAHRYDRLREAARFSALASLVMGLVIAAMIAIAAPYIARSFSTEPGVISLIEQFLWIVPISYTLLGNIHFADSYFNGALKPFRATLMAFVWMFVFVVPLASLGAQLQGVLGIYLGIAAGNGLVGIGSLWLIRSLINQTEAHSQTGIHSGLATIRSA